jgi:hypothetical protein
VMEIEGKHAVESSEGNQVAECRSVR